MKERITHLAPSAYKIMPWKNGAGSTTELWIAPAGASLQSGFDWRISLAQVPTSGPFSSFPHYERTIILLRGDPMRLVHRGRDEHLLQAFQPYDFHGSWETEGLLSGRPVEDFNVMVRDSFGHAHVHVQNGSENPIFSPQNANLHFIYCHQGSVSVEMQNQKLKISKEESLFIEDSTKPTLCADSTSTLAVIVSIVRSSF